MPYMRMDEGAYDDMLSEIDPDELPEGLDRPSGAFEYEGAETSFKPEKLGTIARLTLDALKAMGATAFHVRYDGGHDEGFAHPDYVVIDAVQVAAEAVKEWLAQSDLSERIRSAAEKEPRLTAFGRSSADQLIEHALWELAEELASKLLGDGYGTGEYSLYGAFRADLITGKIEDDQSAKMPDEMK